MAVAATRFKNEFGAIFEQAAPGGAVAITKHNTPKAVLLSYAEFEALTKSASPALDDLTDEFDELQTAASKEAMAAAFEATPRALGRAAVKLPAHVELLILTCPTRPLTLGSAPGQGVCPARPAEHRQAPARTPAAARWVLRRR